MKNLKKNSAFITKIASVITIFSGIIVLVGWLFEIPLFKSVVPHFGSMRYVTALCFLLSGTILFILKEGPLRSKSGKNLAFLLTILLLFFGSLSLLSCIFGWNIDLKPLFWNSGGHAANHFFPGRLSLIVSFNFTMLGIAFLLIGKEKYQLLVQLALAAILPGTLLVILNHLVGVSFLTSIQFSVPTSMFTAILFLVIAIGIFMSPGLAYFQFSFVKKIAVFFVLIIMVRGIIFFAINKNNQLAEDKVQWVEQNHEVLNLAEKLNALSNEIQSGVRGFIITDEEKYPVLIANSENSIDQILERLRYISVENTGRQILVDSLQGNIDSFIVFQRNLIRTRREKGFDAVQKVILEDQGRILLEKVHNAVAAIEQDQNQLLALHQVQIKTNVKNSSKLFELFQLIAFLLMVAAFIMIYDHVKKRNKMESALQRSLKETSDYRYALDRSSILAITDQNGIISQVNDNFCKISKFSREELIGQDHAIMNSGFHSRDFIRDLWLTISNGEEWKGEIKNRAKDGTYFWLDTTIVPFMDDRGKPYQFVAIRSDITKRKELEESINELNRQLQNRVEERTREVIEKEQKYRFLLQNMQEGVHVIGHDWKYHFVNKSAIEQVKYHQKELIGHTIMENYPGIEDSQLFKVLETCMIQRLPNIIEEEFTFPDGSRQWFRLSIQPVSEGLFILSMDITGQKNAEHRLLESERFLNESQSISKIGSYVLNFTSGQWMGSPEMENIFGLPSIAKHSIDEWVSMVHPDHRRLMLDYFNQEVIGNKQRFDKEYKIINKKSNKECWVHGIGELEFDADGVPVRMLGTVQDIDAQKKIADLLLRNELQFRSAFENSPHGMAIINPCLRFKEVNETLSQITGYSVKELLGFRLVEIIHPEDMAKVRVNFDEIIQKNRKTTWQYEVRFIHRRGHIINVFSCGSAIKGEDGEVLNFVGQMQDITEKKQAQQKLNEEKKLLKTIIDNLPINVYMKDLSSRKTMVNKKELEFSGRKSEEELLGKSDFDLYPKEFAMISVEEDREVFLEKVSIINKETISADKDGRETWFLTSKIPFLNENDEVCGLVGISFDITDRKLMEKELVDQQVRQQKLITEFTLRAQEQERAELGRELHDNVNQILATVKMYLDMIYSGNNVPEYNLLGKSIDYVKEAMLEIRKLSHALVAPSIPKGGLSETLRELVEDANLLNRLHVQLLMDDSYEENKLDNNKELMIYRVVQEQLSNITKYAYAKNAVISLKASDGHLILSISDNGNGFETGRETKGIGLRNISSRVASYGGKMNITSAPGEGCTLEVSIPYSPATALPHHSQPEAFSK